MLLIAGVP